MGAGEETRSEGQSYEEGRGNQTKKWWESTTTQRVSGIRWKDSRWDLTIPREFKSTRHVDVRGGERESLMRQSGDATKGATSVVVYEIDGSVGQKARQVRTVEDRGSQRMVTSEGMEDIGHNRKC